MTNRNSNANDAAAVNENAISQAVHITIAGESTASGAGDAHKSSGGKGDCYGQCNTCKTTSPERCPIAKSRNPRTIDYDQSGNISAYQFQG